MLARARPLRHHGSQDVERAQLRSGQERLRGEGVGKDVPQEMQPCARAAADALLLGLARLEAPALRVVDDADRGVAVGRDVDESTDDLCLGRRYCGQQATLRMLQAEMQKD